MKQFLSTSMLILISTSTVAETPTWFEIELYLYKQKNETKEAWPDPQPKAYNSEYFTLIHGDNVKKNNQYQWVARKEKTYFLKNSAPFLLTKDHLKLKRKVAYLNHHIDNEPVMHVAWKQGIVSKQNSIPFRIIQGRNFGEIFRPNGFEISDTNKVEEELNQPKTIKNVYEIDGEITIYLDHYLFIIADITLRKEGAKTVRKYDTLSSLLPQGGSSTYNFLEQIPMKQNRRVRSGEIHYFDHPYLGMIIQIRRLKEQPS